LLHIFFLVIVFAGKTFAADMSVFFGAGVTFVQKPAAPEEIDTPFGITLLFLEDIIGRYRSSETVMRGMIAGEDIVALVLVDINVPHGKILTMNISLIRKNESKYELLFSVQNIQVPHDIYRFAIRIGIPKATIVYGD
jgi:hypothetical protein